MSKNGFHHEYPYAQDVYVSPDVEALIGKKHINGTVSNSRYDDDKHIIADCTSSEGKFIVKNYPDIMGGGGTHWLAVEKK